MPKMITKASGTAFDAYRLWNFLGRASVAMSRPHVFPSAEVIDGKTEIRQEKSDGSLGARRLGTAIGHRRYLQQPAAWQERFCRRRCKQKDIQEEARRTSKAGGDRREGSARKVAHQGTLQEKNRRVP